MKAEDLKGMNGRKVLVEGVILNCIPDKDGDVVVTIATGFSAAHGKCIQPSAIREILPQEIGVGDTVKWSGSVRCSVRFIDDGYAWVRDAEDSYIVPLSSLTLIEPAQ